MSFLRFIASFAIAATLTAVTLYFSSQVPEDPLPDAIDDGSTAHFGTLKVALAPAGVRAQTATADIDLNGYSLPPSGLVALQVALAEVGHPLARASQIAITSIRDEGNLQLISLVETIPNAETMARASDMPSALALLSQDDVGNWRAVIDGSPTFGATLSLVAAPSIANALMTNDLAGGTIPRAQSGSGAVDYRWPWASGKSWGWWQGWHLGNGLDFGTSGADRRLLAAADGVVTFVCRGRLGTGVKIRDADGATVGYWHVAAGSLAPEIHEGARVKQGQLLGELRAGTYSEGGPCRQFATQQPTNAHVHLTLPTDRLMSIDGWTIQPGVSAFGQSGEQRVCPGACYRAGIKFESSNGAGEEPAGEPALAWYSRVLYGRISDPITVTLRGERMRAGDALTVTIAYDSEVLTLQQATAGGSPEDMSTGVVEVDNNAGLVRAKWAGQVLVREISAPIVPEMTLTFIPHAWRETAISVNMATLSRRDEPIVVRLPAAARLLVGGCAGDADHNAIIDADDARQISAAWRAAKLGQPIDARLDWNSNGDIDAQDAQQTGARLGRRCGTATGETHDEQASGTQIAVVAPSEVTLGQVVTVPVRVENARELGAYEFDLRFDSSMMEVLTMTHGSMPLNAARLFTRIPPVIDNKAGLARYGAYSRGSRDAGLTGAGTLVNIVIRYKTTRAPEFQVTRQLFADVSAAHAQGAIMWRVFAPVICEDCGSKSGARQ